jgi:hypothetical protein
MLNFVFSRDRLGADKPPVQAAHDAWLQADLSHRDPPRSICDSFADSQSLPAREEQKRA